MKFHFCVIYCFSLKVFPRVNKPINQSANQTVPLAVCFSCEKFKVEKTKLDYASTLVIAPLFRVRDFGSPRKLLFPLCIWNPSPEIARVCCCRNPNEFDAGKLSKAPLTKPAGWERCVYVLLSVSYFDRKCTRTWTPSGRETRVAVVSLNSNGHELHCPASSSICRKLKHSWRYNRRGEETSVRIWGMSAANEIS